MFWKEDYKDKMSLSYHNKGTCYQKDITTDVDLDHLAEVVLLHCNYSLPSPSVVYSQEESHPVQLTLQWGVMLHSLRVAYLHELFGIPLQGIFAYSPPFIYLVIYFYQYGLMGISFFRLYLNIIGI